MSPSLPIAIQRASLLRRSGLALALLVLAACAEKLQPSHGSQGVLLITVDGLRADHVQALGGPRPTTPRLDALAAEGLSFSDAISAAPLLEPAHIGILTGSTPDLARQFYQHRSGAARWQIPRAMPHLAVEFLSAGYQTAAFIDEDTLAPSEGFARGFQQYLLLDPDVPSAERAGRHARRLRDWLQSLDRGDSWFAYFELSDLDRAWIEPLEPWDTYFSPSKSKGMRDVPAVATTDGSFFAIPQSRWRGGSRTLGDYEASYDGHLRRLDKELGSIISSLRNLGRMESTTVVVVGSYGVQFGEAGLYLSSGMLSLADLHVPWIMRPRAGLLKAAPGTQVDAVVSLMDLAPTLLEMEGLEKPAGMHGHSLAGYLEAEPPAKPLREQAYASNGLIDGYAVVGEQYVLEVLRTNRIENRLHRLSWNGSHDFETEGHSIRYYDRTQNRFPSLQPYQRKVGAPHREFVKRFRAGEEWAFRTFKSRCFLQRGGLWGKPVEPETLELLVRLGYLGPTP